MSFRPFLVADRPSALRIIRGAMPDLSATGLGIMTHANITDNVANFIREFPSSGGFYDYHDDFELDDESHYVGPNGEFTQTGGRIRDQSIIICDSGAFQKEGAKIGHYPTLFDRYDDLKVDYGIINDVLNDDEKTYEEAAEAIAAFNPDKRSFSLVGVAQGTSLSEYVRSYEQLRDLGYEHIAIGGLLSKSGNRSGKFAQISDTEFMKEILRTVRERYPDDWIFALGCHHPSRHQFFEDLDLYGADYKGWLFKYQSQFNDRLQDRHWRFQELRSFLRQNVFRQSVGDPSSRLLILPMPDDCSASSRSVSAWKRFQGGYCSTLRKWRQEVRPEDDDVDVMFISDSHGLVPDDYLLPSETVNNEERIIEPLNKSLRTDFAKLLRYRRYNQAFIAGGEQHRSRCRPLKTLVGLDSDATTEIIEVSGSFGEQLQQLRNWLNDTTDRSGEFVVSTHVC